MLARRSLLLAASRSGLCRPAARSALPVASAASALTTSRRHMVGAQLASNLAVHATQAASCFSLSTLLYSPLGTAMLVVLAYNVVVIGTKHVNYSMEITAKDYVQDQQLYVIMRYGILSCILLGMEVMFVEV